MEPSFIITTKILILLFFWLMAFILLKKGFNYIRYPLLMFFYFSCLSLLALYFNWDLLEPFFLDFTITPFIFLLLILIAVPIIYYLSRKYLRNPAKVIRYLPGQPNLSFEYTYIIPKFMNLIFQQIITLTFIAILLIFLTPETTVIMVSLIFCCLHIPVFITDGLGIGLLYFISAYAAGFIFSIMILTINYGFVYNIIIHWSFYICLGLYFWLRYTIDSNYKL